MFSCLEFVFGRAVFDTIYYGEYIEYIANFVGIFTNTTIVCGICKNAYENSLCTLFYIAKHQTIRQEHGL